MPTTMPHTHEVIDIQTGKSMGKYKSGRAAYDRADKLDMAYGAVRYVVKLI